MARGTGITGELDLAADPHEPPDQPDPRDLVITTDRLTKTYGPRHAVHELSLAIERGEVFGLLGPNGAGKTTTLRMLLGLIRPTSGWAEVLDARPGSSQSLAGVGALVEEPALYPYLSGRDNLRVLSRYCKAPKSRVDQVLDRVGLLPRARDKVKTYSLGMRQRLGVAAALLKDPEVLILDEPTNGLDPQGMAQMRWLIRQVATGDRTVVLSSHLLSEVEQVCDRIGVLSDGKLIAQGPVSQLRGASAIHIQAEPFAHARTVLEAIPQITSVTAQADRLIVDAPAALAADVNATLIEHGIAVSHLSVAQRSLEDVFLDMTAAEAEPGAEVDSGAGQRGA